MPAKTKVLKEYNNRRELSLQHDSEVSKRESAGDEQVKDIKLSFKRDSLRQTDRRTLTANHIRKYFDDRTSLK
jgi:hypothetical protein